MNKLNWQNETVFFLVFACALTNIATLVVLWKILGSYQYKLILPFVLVFVLFIHSFLQILIGKIVKIKEGKVLR